MKNVNLLLLLIVLGMGSCTTEKGPYINFFGTKASDTSYLGNIESAQPRNVLIEEFTGASCSNCPQGHATINSLEATYPERVISVGYHINDFPQANPIAGLSAYDFRTKQATDIGNVLGPINLEPSASIDRVLNSTGFPSNYTESRSNWPVKVANRIAITAGVNMYVTSTFKAADTSAVIDVKVVFAGSVTKKTKLNVAIIESGILDAQEDSNAPSFIDTVYTHNHVLRDMLTADPRGDSFLDTMATKPAGRVYERIFIYKPNDTKYNKKWNLANCKIVAWVNYGESNNIEVAQAVTTNLK